MPVDFRPLASDADLDRVLEASHDAPVIVFKHSETCGVSAMAEELLDQGSVSTPIHRLVVQHHRRVSNRVAAALGVRHESPQALVIARGKAVWHTSHAGVTSERVRAAYDKAQAAMTTAVSA